MARAERFEDLEVWQKARDLVREFLQFLAIAKGSCGETRSHLVAAQDQKYVSEDAFTEARERALEVSRMISGLMGHLRRSSLRGSKYR